MTRAEIAAMIAGIGLPNAYDHFTDNEKPSGPPFICFLYGDSDDFMADDGNYASITPLVIELYTDNVDFTLEAAVETALATAGLPYVRSREWIDSERMYLTTYETEVLLTPDPPTPDPPTPTEAEPDNTEVLDTNGQ